MTGKIEKDLEQARGTIDILEMLKAKCRTDTPDDLLRILDGAVMDLQLNYVDELKKRSAEPGESHVEENEENGENDEADD
jgi:hypothetical protein